MLQRYVADITCERCCHTGRRVAYCMYLSGFIWRDTAALVGAEARHRGLALFAVSLKYAYLVYASLLQQVCLMCVGPCGAAFGSLCGCQRLKCRGDEETNLGFEGSCTVGW